jgi:hypothetical protein
MFIVRYTNGTIKRADAYEFDIVGNAVLFYDVKFEPIERGSHTDRKIRTFVIAFSLSNIIEFEEEK